MAFPLERKPAKKAVPINTIKNMDINLPKFFFISRKKSVTSIFFIFTTLFLRH